MTEVVVVLVIVLAVLIVVFTLAVLRKARCGTASLQDKMQMQQIHKAVVVCSGEMNGRYPTPGLIQPLRPVGAEPIQDFSLNHSAPLYSYLVASDYFKPELLVSPDCIAETPAVRIKSDYDYSAYKPAINQFWDTTFSMRIDDPKIGANSSYAHMAICGDRREIKWRATGDAGSPVFGTRGTRGGALSGPDFDRSPTLRLHLPKNQWTGHVCFADNHADTLHDFFHPLVSFVVGQVVNKDNIYAAEFSDPRGNQAAADAFLGVFAGASEFGVSDVYDPLDK